MQSDEYPVIFDCDKKQKFGVSDNGEFLDSEYREQASSTLIGKLIGRNYVEPNSKKVFTNSDIVCEGYLYKKGSWFTNWKKRYFILRKDIRALCYYHSRESLVLLGSIPLDIETKLSNIQPKDADGFENVVALQSEDASTTFIRFDTFSMMKAWMIDIKNEAQHMHPATEADIDWWASLFNEVSVVQNKSNALRRGGHTASTSGSIKKQVKKSRSVSPPSSRKNTHATSHNISSADRNSARQGLNSKITFDDRTESDEVSAMLLNGMHLNQDSDEEDSDNEDKAKSRNNSSGVRLSRTQNRSSNSVPYTTHESSRDSNRALYESIGIGPLPISPQTIETEKQDVKVIRNKNPIIEETIAINEYSSPKHRGSGFIKTDKKKMKLLKADKQPGPAPYKHPSIDQFVDKEGVIAGLQLSIRLCNVCGYLDKLFVVIFGSVALERSQDDTAVTDDSKVGIVGGSKWLQLSRTEWRTVAEKPAYGENYVQDYRMHFSIIQNNIPESCKDIKIVVYRLESDMNPKEPAKATNLNHQLEIARTVIARKLFVSQNIFKVPMQVKIELPMDIAIPLFKPSEVTLGVVHLMSSSLADKRKKMKNAIKVSPYSEMLYSFSTTTGQAFSVEQLYALPYSVQLSQALLSLWFQERYDFMEESLRTLRQQLDLLNQDNAAITQALTTDTISSGSSEVVATIRDDSTFLQAIDVLDEIFNDCIDCAAHALDTCKKATTGQGIINNVIDIEHGGNVLRRSTWKKITAWQYCTTNLNLHIMVNKLYSFADILENKEANDSSRTLHCIPTITLGVPAAHELKFSEGGLRKIFSDISTHDNKLRWLQAIQAPDLQMLKILFVTHSKEAASLFGSSYMLTNKEELAKVLKRKYELARRIDICSSQALGCAVSVVKSIIMLATIVGGNCKDVLARSLKIGFLVLFQSMLSTNGDELGMIEDLDIAALWLSLVSIRLVRKTDMKGEAVAPTGILKRPTNLEGLESPCTKKRKTAIDVILSSKCYSEDGVPVYKGVGEGVSCQRDEGGRLIVDIEVTNEEGATIMEALASMKDFERIKTTVLSADTTFSFSENPVLYHTNRSRDSIKVYAVVELFGLTFTQGVNEMQTLANLSASRDVFKQIEINNGSKERLSVFYESYRAALTHQLSANADKMKNVLTTLGEAESLMQQSPLDQKLYDSGRMSPMGDKAPQMAISRSLSKKKSTRAFSVASTINDNVTLTVTNLKTKVLSYNDRLFDRVLESIQNNEKNPYDKHINVLLTASALGREIGGTVGILCKSGKDRTSMGVTLENTRSLVEDLGALHGQEVCHMMRFQGVRRMNVYANTGQSMFAFNQLQKLALPHCYRPPPGCHSGNVTS